MRAGVNRLPACLRTRSPCACAPACLPALLTLQKAHDGDINSIRWDPGSKVLASGSDDGRVKLWSLNSERPLHVLEGHSAGVPAVRWGTSTSSRPCLASSSYDGTVRVWDTETGTCLHTLHSHTQVRPAAAGGGTLHCRLG